MLHLLCECGSLVSVVPPPGARSAQCRSCRAVVVIPDPAVVGITDAAVATPPGLLPRAEVPPEDGIPPGAEALPRFDSDERLDLRSLQGRARQMRVLGPFVLCGGVVVAAAAALYVPWTPAGRALAASGALFVGLAGWGACRAAGEAAMAAVALAQRQRELLRGMRPS